MDESLMDDFDDLNLYHSIYNLYPINFDTKIEYQKSKLGKDAQLRIRV